MKILINVIIVEDSLGYRTFLIDALNSFGYYNIISAFENAQSVRQYLQQPQNIPDLIIMDIKLNGSATGIDLATQIEKYNIPIIFVTQYADDDYYKQVEILPYYAFIIKPFHPLTLDAAIKNLLKMVVHKPNFGLEFKQGSTLRFIEFSEMIYLETEGNYTKVVANDKKYMYKISLVKILPLLKGEFLVRIHRNFIVNLMAVEKVDYKKMEVVTKSIVLPLGRSFRKEFEEKLHTYYGNS